MGKYRGVVADVLLWIVALFLIYVFTRQGISKFSDSSGWAQAFRVWHYPVWFRICVGAAEIAAALLLLTRRTASGGAAVIMVIMMGAMGTHIWWGHPEQITSEILPLTLATIVAIGRRSHFFLRRPTETAA
ncbi:MAG: DoxX family protein [Candidatus Polarisedimenticolia bacterium]